MIGLSVPETSGRPQFHRAPWWVYFGAAGVVIVMVATWMILSRQDVHIDEGRATAADVHAIRAEVEILKTEVGRLHGEVAVNTEAIDEAAGWGIVPSRRETGQPMNKPRSTGPPAPN